MNDLGVQPLLGSEPPAPPLLPLPSLSPCRTSPQCPWSLSQRLRNSPDHSVQITPLRTAAAPPAWRNTGRRRVRACALSSERWGVAVGVVQGAPQSAATAELRR